MTTLIKDEYRVVSLMSGSSLDGLDIAYVRYWKENDRWRFDLLQAETVPYPRKWELRLFNLAYQDAITYLKTSAYYGLYLGEEVSKFLERHGIARDQVDFVASHGHTIFHQPENHVSSQVGDGAKIAAVCGMPVVSNFRDSDVALGGQGAPITPVGDYWLFPEFVLTLNLGGFANLTARLKDGRLIGFDIVAVNLILNHYARELGKPMDENGQLGKDGVLDNDLLERLNAIWYYEKPFPKCLSIGWVNRVLFPILRRARISKLDILRTYYEHIAIQIGRAVKVVHDIGLAADEPKMLVTGGGAFNQFLLERLQDHVHVEMILPQKEIIKFKEAIIIGFLGVLRMRGEPNVYASVTGAERDSVNGAVWLPPPSSSSSAATTD